MHIRTSLLNTVAAASLASCLALVGTPLAIASPGGLLAGIAAGDSDSSAEVATTETPSDVEAEEEATVETDAESTGQIPSFHLDLGLGNEETGEADDTASYDLVWYETATHGAIELQVPSDWAWSSESSDAETYVEYESEWGLFQLMVTNDTVVILDDAYITEFVDAFSAELPDFTIIGQDTYFLDGVRIQTIAYTATLDEETPLGGYITFMAGNNIVAVAASAFLNDTSVNAEIPSYTRMHSSIGIAPQV